MKPTYPGALAFVLGVLTAVTAHAWVLQTVDPAGVTDFLLGDKSIAVDSAGKVHISYHSYGDVLIN